MLLGIIFKTSLKDKSSHPERDTGIARDFGNFYRRLYKNFPRQTFGFFHEAFENYLATQWDGGYLNSKLGRIEMPDDCDRKFLSGVETAKLLKMKEAWVLQCDRLSVELACQLHTSPRKIVSLLRDRNIPPVTGKSVDGGRQYLFIRKKTENIFPKDF